MTYQVKDNRVYGNGKSYTLPNNVTAKDLCSILNEFEKTSRDYHKLKGELSQLQKELETSENTIHELRQSLSELSD